MPLSLMALDVDRIMEALAGGRMVAGIPVVPGALPPPLLLDHALSELRAGQPAPWHAPFLLAFGDRIVGSGGFKGPPRDGRVEIGYNVAPTERGRGFATGAVILLCRLAAEQPGVDELFAETAVDNRPSQRVLEKAGFLKTGTRESVEDGPVFQWRRPVTVE